MAYMDAKSKNGGINHITDIKTLSKKMFPFFSLSYLREQLHVIYNIFVVT